MAITPKEILKARAFCREIENKIKSQERFKGSEGRKLLQDELARRRKYLIEIENKHSQ